MKNQPLIIQYEAEAIVDRFFQLGARVSKADLDYIVGILERIEKTASINTYLEK